MMEKDPRKAAIGALRRAQHELGDMERAFAELQVKIPMQREHVESLKDIVQEFPEDK